MTTLELAGIAHELKFWKGFVRTDRFISGWVSNQKTPELSQVVYDFIKSVPHEKVLDVGSGVCSILNGTCNVITADPLGQLYELIFGYTHYNIIPPLPIPAEELMFKNEFDIVHCSNALDHSQDPKLAFEKMYTATKSGGFLIIQGFENEATFENYSGFHQWNIYIDEKTNILCIDGKEGNLTGLVNPILAKKVKLESGKDWFIWIMQKTL